MTALFCIGIIDTHLKLFLGDQGMDLSRCQWRDQVDGMEDEQKGCQLRCSGNQHSADGCWGFRYFSCCSFPFFSLYDCIVLLIIYCPFQNGKSLWQDTIPSFYDLSRFVLSIVSFISELQYCCFSRNSELESKFSSFLSFEFCSADSLIHSFRTRRSEGKNERESEGSTSRRLEVMLPRDVFYKRQVIYRLFITAVTQKEMKRRESEEAEMEKMSRFLFLAGWDESRLVS